MMGTNNLVRWCERFDKEQVVAYSMIVLLTFYQMIGVFYGVDLCDSGFVLTFYDNIFTSPESVQYNFMYYLCGIIGGAIQFLIPGIGMVGMRLVTVAINLIVMCQLFSLFRKILPTKAIILGFSIVLIAFIKGPFTFSYDTVTSLFYVLLIIGLYRGLTNNASKCIFVAGVFAGLNIFARVSNVVDIAAVGLVIIYCLYMKISWKQCCIWILTFFAGVIVAIIGVVLIMKLMGHLDIFIANMADLKSIGSSTQGEASHSMIQLIVAQFRFYIDVLKGCVKLGLPCLGFIYAPRIFRQKMWIYTMQALCIVVMLWFTTRMPDLLPVFVYCSLGCVYMLIVNKDIRIKLLSCAGLMMMILFPLGCDNAAYNNGSIIAWVAAPLASVIWIKRNNIAVVLIFLSVSGISATFEGVYFEGGALWNKTALVECKRMSYIHTTPERANAINELLECVRPYINTDDVLFAYGNIPTINYLTHTQPYIGCNWPEQLSASMLEQKLSQCKAPFPLVLRQKFNTIGNEWGKPSDSYLMNYDNPNIYMTNQKIKIINDFLNRHDYVPIMQTEYFVLYRTLN